MKLAALILSLVCTATSFAQDTPRLTRRPIRFVIRHADPYFVKAMLEGQALISPELSTILGVAGGAAGAGAKQAAGQTNALFSDGFFVVNPTDNSLWFYPKN